MFVVIRIDDILSEYSIHTGIHFIALHFIVLHKCRVFLRIEGGALSQQKDHDWLRHTTHFIVLSPYCSGLGLNTQCFQGMLAYRLHQLQFLHFFFLWGMFIFFLRVLLQFCRTSDIMQAFFHISPPVIRVSCIFIYHHLHHAYWYYIVT